MTVHTWFKSTLRSLFALFDIEEHWTLVYIWQAGELDLAVNVGRASEVEFPHTELSVLDQRVHLRVIDRLAVAAGHLKLGRARTDSAIEHRDGFRCRLSTLRRLLLRWG